MMLYLKGGTLNWSYHYLQRKFDQMDSIFSLAGQEECIATFSQAIKKICVQLGVMNTYMNEKYETENLEKEDYDKWALVSQEITDYVDEIIIKMTGYTRNSKFDLAKTN